MLYFLKAISHQIFLETTPQRYAELRRSTEGPTLRCGQATLAGRLGVDSMAWWNERQVICRVHDPARIGVVAGGCYCNRVPARRFGVRVLRELSAAAPVRERIVEETLMWRRRLLVWR